MHLGANYYLTVGVCVMACFAVDLTVSTIRFAIFSSPPDFLRALVKKKDLSVEDL